jgi:DNA replication protein DnaC
VNVNDAMSPDLRAVLRRLKLSGVLDTLPDRLALARQQKMPHQDFLLLLLSDEVSRRDSQSATLRAQKAGLDHDSQLERWDDTAKVTFDRAVLNELASLRFVDEGRHAVIVGPVGVGKTFLAHALGHIACRRGYSVIATTADHMLKRLRHARLTQTHEAELLRFISADLLVVDDFALDTMDPQESRDVYEVLVERHRAGSMIVTSNRGPDEWLATFADPMRAQSAIDRFVNNSYDLVVEGETYRSRLKPQLSASADELSSLQTARRVRRPKARGRRRR